MKKKCDAKMKGFGISVLLGYCASCIVALFAMSAISAMILGGSIKEELLRICVPVVHFIALFSGGLVTGYMCKEKLLYSGVLLLALLYFICTAITILLFDGQFVGVVPNFFMGIIGVLCAMLIHFKWSLSGKSHYRKRKFVNLYKIER